jgi:hypothetical protein
MRQSQELTHGGFLCATRRAALVFALVPEPRLYFDAYAAWRGGGVLQFPCVLQHPVTANMPATAPMKAAILFTYSTFIFRSPKQDNQYRISPILVDRPIFRFSAGYFKALIAFVEGFL